MAVRSACSFLLTGWVLQIGIRFDEKVDDDLYFWIRLIRFFALGPIVKSIYKSRRSFYQKSFITTLFVTFFPSTNFQQHRSSDYADRHQPS